MKKQLLTALIALIIAVACLTSCREELVATDCVRGFGFLRLVNKTGETATVTVNGEEVGRICDGKAYSTQVEVGMHSFRIEGCTKRSVYVDTCETEEWTCGD